MTLEEVNSKYHYKSDKEKYGTSLDVWEIPEEIDGVIESDCESYCRLLKAKVEWFKDWDYWYCKLEGVGHCVLMKDGQVIDCNVQDVISLDRYCMMYRVEGFKKYGWFQVGAKIGFSWGYLLWKKLSK